MVGTKANKAIKTIFKTLLIVEIAKINFDLPIACKMATTGG
jgi:hypothetical protein